MKKNLIFVNILLVLVLGLLVGVWFSLNGTEEEKGERPEETVQTADGAGSTAPEETTDPGTEATATTQPPAATQETAGTEAPTTPGTTAGEEASDPAYGRNDNELEAGGGL